VFGREDANERQPLTPTFPLRNQNDRRQVAGTRGGITAVQLDTKLPGLPVALLADALAPAAAARSQIIGRMEAALERYEAGTPEALRPGFGSVEIDRELVPRLIGLQVGAGDSLGLGRGRALSACTNLLPTFAVYQASHGLFKPTPPKKTWQGINLLDIEAKTGGRLIVADSGEVFVYAPTRRRYDHAVEAVVEVEGRSIREGDTYRVKVGGVCFFWGGGG
jgi:hypothetical protein